MVRWVGASAACGAWCTVAREAVLWERRALQLKTRQTMSTVTPSVMSHMPLARWAAKADRRGAAKADTRGATRRSMMV